MNWIKYIKQLLISTFSRRLSTSKIKQLVEPKRIEHEFEDSVGKGKNFPVNRGRFTVLKIENINNEG